MTTASALELLRSHPFLAGLPDEWLVRLAPLARRVAYYPGQRLFLTGRTADRLWLIHTGRVALELEVPDGTSVVLETIGPDEVLGWSWLFPPYEWQFTAVAAEQVYAVELDGAGVRRLCQEEPVLGYELTRRFVGVVVDRLQASRKRLIELYGYRSATPV